MDSHRIDFALLGQAVGRTADNMRKIRRAAHGTSKGIAKALEGATGISRLNWLYPEDYTNPWEEIKRDWPVYAARIERWNLKREGEKKSTEVREGRICSNSCPWPL